MIEVEVLYADLSRQTVEFGAIETLPKTGVLALLVRDTVGQPSTKNIVDSLGFDFYALCWSEIRGQPWVLLRGYDDGDFVWRRLSNHRDSDAVVPVDMPLGCFHIIFHGQSVDDATWIAALEIWQQDIL